MHVLESYALNSGAKISKPDIIEKFFPIVSKNYVTLDADKRTQSKHYLHWQEVVDILSPILEKHSIDIVQLGAQEDQALQKTYNTTGQTTNNQKAHLIRGARLHVGPDNISMDLASHLDKKIVAIFGNCLPSHFEPYWSKPEDVILIAPEWNEEKPCYSFEESPKSIDSIPPEKIVRSICELLDINFDYEYKYLFIGDQYSRGMINVVPDTPISSYGEIPRIPISIRMDLNFNEEILVANLQLGQFSIVTNKPIRPDIISTFKQNIHKLTYVIEENNEPNFIKFLLNNTVEHSMISFLPREKLDPIKLNYMDFGVLIEQEKRKRSDIEDKLKDNPLYYKSNKFILSGGKIYPSQPAWKRGLNMPSFEKIPQPVIDDPELWEDVDNYCILTK